MKPMHLLTTYYIPENKKRQKELQSVVETNLRLNIFESIILFMDENTDISFTDNVKSTTKVVPVIIKGLKRVSFKLLVDYANEHLNNTICLISNSDIAFDNTLLNAKYFNYFNRVYAITRFEQNGEMTANPHNSQDVWMFLSPTPAEISPDILIGTWGCDNAFSFDFHRAGKEVLNAYDVIKCYHIHESNFRTYEPIHVYAWGRIRGGYVLNKLVKLATAHSSEKEIPIFRVEKDGHCSTPVENFPKSGFELADPTKTLKGNVRREQTVFKGVGKNVIKPNTTKRPKEKESGIVQQPTTRFDNLLRIQRGLPPKAKQII